MKNSTINTQSPPEQRGENKIHIDQVNAELPKAYNRFIFYQTENGDPRLLYDELGAEQYACFVARLSHPEFQKTYTFFRVVLEAINQIKKQNKKGLEAVLRIENYVRNW